MKSFKKLLIAIICLVLVFSNAKKVIAEENPYGEPFKMHTTAYYYGHTTATGAKVREGICAVKKEWIGKTAIIYERNEDGSVGDLLGIWECLDTGFGGDADGDGVGSIQEGKVIDVYFPNLEKCKEWMKLTGGKCYVQLIDAVG